MVDTIYHCEICNAESDKPVRWVVVHCDDGQLTLYKWTKEAADAPHAQHYCGESHAQVFISRWFDSICCKQKSAQGEVIEFSKKSMAEAK
jgi:hypothetical protein